jgi:hypothetical protein
LEKLANSIHRARKKTQKNLFTIFSTNYLPIYLQPIHGIQRMDIPLEKIIVRIQPQQTTAEVHIRLAGLR